MIGKLFGKELNAALVANGPGRVSLRRTVSGVLSNPVPRREPLAVGEAPVSAPLRAA